MDDRIRQRRRRVIIHVGQTKAGSTSIQNYLDDQREALSAHGVLFPQSMMQRRNPFDQSRTAGHLALLSALASDQAEPFRLEIAAGDATVLLSMENLFTDRPDAAITPLGAFFRDWDVTLVAVLRPQADWLRSRHVENVLSGFRASTQPFGPFMRDSLRQGALDYGARLDRLACLTGADRVVTVPFGGGGGPLIRRFLHALDLPVTDPDQIDRHDNRRDKSAALIEAVRRLNLATAGMSRDQRLDLEGRLRAEAGGILSADAPAYLPIVPRSIIARCRATNRAMFEAGRTARILPAGRVVPTPPEPDPRAIQAIIFAGLRLVTQIAQASDRKVWGLPQWSEARCAALVQAMAAPGCWLHWGSPETGLLALMTEQRLRRDIIAVPQGRQAEALQARLDQGGAAGSVLLLDVGAARAQITPVPGLRGLVLGPDIASGRLAAILSETPAPTVLMPWAALDKMPNLPAGWHASNPGGVVTLSFRGGSGQEACEKPISDEGYRR